MCRASRSPVTDGREAGSWLCLEAFPGLRDLLGREYDMGKIVGKLCIAPEPERAKR
jgi:hypothetical protein